MSKKFPIPISAIASNSYLLFLIRKCIEQISIFTLFATLEEGFFNDPKVHQRFIRKVATTKKGLSHKKLSLLFGVDNIFADRKRDRISWLF